MSDLSQEIRQEFLDYWRTILPALDEAHAVALESVCVASVVSTAGEIFESAILIDWPEAVFILGHVRVLCDAFAALEDQKPLTNEQTIALSLTAETLDGAADYLKSMTQGNFISAKNSAEQKAQFRASSPLPPKRHGMKLHGLAQSTLVDALCQLANTAPRSQL